MCCGTKRLKQIKCPSDCAYLATAREHPAAIQIRRQQRDLEAFVPFIRDLNERQSQLFFLVATFLARYQSPELQPLVDEDVSEAAAALASTFETASRGLIYDHRPASLPAERLVSGLKPLLAEAGATGGSAFERDAAVVLRRIEGASRALRTREPSDRGAFLELLSRMIRSSADAEPGAAPPEPSRLIVP